MEMLDAGAFKIIEVQFANLKIKLLCMLQISFNFELNIKESFCFKVQVAHLSTGKEIPRKNDFYKYLYHLLNPFI